MKEVVYKYFIILSFCGLIFTNCTEDIVKDADPAEKADEKFDEVKPTENAKTYTLTPDKNGRLDIDNKKAGTYQPGDVIYLKGNFKSVYISGLKGTAGHPIFVTNYPGLPVIIGDPAWNGGAYCCGIRMDNCHHFVLGGGSNKSDFIINGSVQSARYSYFGIELRPFTDNAEVKNITIKNGGIGIVAKTDPEINDSKTWHPNSRLDNLSIHDLTITGTSNEGMYIGHTAVLWGWNEKGVAYNATGMTQNPAHKYVQPIKWYNVKIYNIYLNNIGCDGIQTAAIDNLEIYNNEVCDFGKTKDTSHSTGIQVGGRATNSNTHDNYIHDGFGEMFQFQGSGEGNATHIVKNNLLVNSKSNGMGIYGADNAGVQIINNTIVSCDGYAIDANNRNVKMTTDHILNNNVFIEAKGWKFSIPDPYLKVENGAKVKENGNLRYATVKDAQIDPNNSYQPLSGSKIGDKGYKKK